MRIDFDIDPKIKIKTLTDLVVPPVIVKVNKFDEDSAKKFNEDMTLAHNTGQKVIPILIDSYGGQVYSLMSMIDCIKSSKLSIATICTGKAMSCGSLLFSFGHDGLRFAGPNATFMIHEVATGTSGKIEELKVDIKEAERLNKIAFKMISNNCGKNDDYFQKIVHEKNHADWFLDVHEAQSHNLVNHVRVPTFNVKITTDVMFE